MKGIVLKSLLALMSIVCLLSCAYDSHDFQKDLAIFSQDGQLTTQEYSILVSRVLESASDGGFMFIEAGKYISIKSEKDLAAYCKSHGIKVTDSRWAQYSVEEMAIAFADEYIEISKYATLNSMIMNDDLGERENMKKLQERLVEYIQTIEDNPEDLETFERTFRTYINRKQMGMAFDIVGGILGFVGNF